MLFASPCLKTAETFHGLRITLRYWLKIPFLDLLNPVLVAVKWLFPLSFQNASSVDYQSLAYLTSWSKWTRVTSLPPKVKLSLPLESLTSSILPGSTCFWASSDFPLPSFLTVLNTLTQKRKILSPRAVSHLASSSCLFQRESHLRL